MFDNPDTELQDTIDYDDGEADTADEDANEHQNTDRRLAEHDRNVATAHRNRAAYIRSRIDS